MPSPKSSSFARLVENGFHAFGWDPAHRPDGQRRKADVVNLGFVVNVIESRHEREETLRVAWSFAERAMAVSAMLLVKADVSGQRPHGDGFLTSRSTFQKYYTQEELLSWVGETLSERAVSLAPGIVGVFRDKNLEQEAAYARRSRAAMLTEKYSVPRRERAAAVPRPELVEVIAPILHDIWQAALELGRVPAQEELDRSVLDALARCRVSFRRAMQLLEGIHDFSALEAIARARFDDLVVFGALSLFPGAPRYSSLSPRIQRDIRHFFGGHGTFVAKAAEALDRLRDRSELIRAFEGSVAIGAATYQNGTLSFAMRHESALDVVIRIMIGCADIVSPGFALCDAIDIGPSTTKLKGYFCQDFDVPLPRLVTTLKVDLARQSSRTLRIDDGVLYCRSRFLSSDDEDAVKQRSIDDRLVAAGIVDENCHGPTGKTLSKLLSKPK
ncbi:DNA phosphorothioation-associated putative methyltransferase [Mesorhizobium sp. KR2-14]|uniref:DNA phosphorothioation-associated putative methyltransferase n=1 Tax=Mesorhizobium sp. KR2-14 TaxID=3156610 RepID=UPI0032B3F538